MDKLFFTRINLRKLCERLSAEQRSRVTNDDAFDWLLGHNFQLGPGGWYAGAFAMDRLRPSEIVAAERIR
jgi:hypothetical protein